VPVPNGQTEIVIPLLPSVARSLLWVHFQESIGRFFAVQDQNPAIRLAYLHNLGDVYVSLAPVVAGLLVTLLGQSLFDPLMALLVAVWLIGTTVQEIRSIGEALLWPGDAVCRHEPLPSMVNY
jgi:Co/Zn/Cd efflux system component